MNIRRILLKLAMPINKYLNKIHLSPSYRNIKAADYRMLKRKIQNGDILLSTMKGEITNLLIPGFWSHAALYVGDDTIIESTSKGVHYSDLIDFMLSKDYVCVVRTKLTYQEIIFAVEKAKTVVGKPYDYFFEPGCESFYCAEVITYAFSSLMPFFRREALGVLTTLPQDFYESKQFQEVYINKG